MHNIGVYFRKSFFSDLKAGFVTAVVALPLAIGFAVASGVPPAMGLYTAVIAGILGSLAGGSRFSVTGPTGAMAVVVLSTVTGYGFEGLFLAGVVAGALQIVFAFLRMGDAAKFMPLPIISGFTAGIGVIIFFGQMGNALGLSIGAHEFIGDTAIELIREIGQTNGAALIITALTILILVFLPKLTARVKWLQSIPASVVALVGTTAVVYCAKISVRTVGDIGEIARAFPSFTFMLDGFDASKINFALLRAVAPQALTIALLGSIEALFCAMVADGMTGTRHKSKRELLMQGALNSILPFFNAIPATAAVARTAVNIREGARTRFSGVYHGVFLLLTILFLAPVANLIPMAFLAGTLMHVSSRMININEFKLILKTSKMDAVAFVLTFAVTIVFGLVMGVLAGIAFTAAIVVWRLASVTDIVAMEEYGPDHRLNRLIGQSDTLKAGIAVYTLNGPFFFGAMSVFEKMVNQYIEEAKPVIILRMKYAPFIDATALTRLKSFVVSKTNRGRHVLITGMRANVEKLVMQDAELRALLNKRVFKKTRDALLYAAKEIFKDAESAKAVTSFKSAME